MTQVKVELPADSELYSLLSFRENDGQINLDQYRMLLLHTETMGVLRKELIDSLGVERARGLFTRMGYESGRNDAILAKKLKPNVSDFESFSIGPQLHKLEGIVKVTSLNVEMELRTGSFCGEFLWENSYEAQTHINQFGIAQEPVCWMQIGYASGYTSTFMGKFILYKEMECTGCGDKFCRIIGKPLEDWGVDNTEYRHFKPDNVADQMLQLQSQVEKLRLSIDKTYELSNIVGDSMSLKAVFELIKNVADSQATVMLLGETGVGKDLFANALHNISNRKNGPFIAVNCAAIPEELIESELFGVEKGAYTGAQKSRPGRFERAHNGSLFLDEVDKLSEAAQTKLLRVLQNHELERVGDVRGRKVNVRIITASNADLEDLVKQGRFRKDLYFRLNIYPVIIPTLRQRKEDIPMLASHFIEKHSIRYGKYEIGIDDEAMQGLLNYDWPGNVREFENVIERGIILTNNNEKIKLSQLLFRTMSSKHRSDISSASEVNPMNATKGITEEIVNESQEFPKFEEVQTLLLEKALQRANGNVSKAAKMLGLTRPQFAYRMKKINNTAVCN